MDTLSVSLKPVSFFKSNPSLDVPGTRDALSVAAHPAQNGQSCHT